MEMNMKSNLAHEPLQPQGEVVRFPKKEQQAMSNKDVSYTKTPNYLVDEDYVARMTGNALKCYTIINRFTEGFSRSNWAIDSSFLLEKTGIKKPHTAYDAVKQLEEFGLLSVHREDGRTNKFTIVHPCQKTAVVPNLGSAEKGNKGDAEKRHNPTAEKRHTKKETFKENIKESSSGSKKPFFEAQKNVMASYVTYFMDDTKYYSLFDLEQKYSVDQDFINQATASYPSLELSIDNISAMFDEMRQWSLTQAAGKKQPQQWMNTWLNWVKNNSHKFSPQARKSKSYQPTSSKNSKTMQDHDEFFAQYGIGSNFQESDFIDVHQSEIKTIGGSDQ